MTFRTISRDNYILNALIMLSIQFLYNNCWVFGGVLGLIIHLFICRCVVFLPRWKVCQSDREYE